MIPRMALDRYRLLRTVPGGDQEFDLFEPMEPLRPMRVLLDADLPRDQQDGSSQLELLVGLLRESWIQTWMYSDAGPPPDAEALAVPTVKRGAKGWISVAETDDEDTWTTHEVIWDDVDGVTMAAIAGNAVEIAEGDERSPAYANRMKRGDVAGLTRSPQEPPRLRTLTCS